MEQNQVTPSALERRIDITLSLADIEKEVDARLKRMARTVKMPGFRPGKVPLKIVAQTHGGQARGEAVGAAVEKAFGEQVREQNLVARSLYAALGFVPCYGYHYRVPPQPI